MSLVPLTNGFMSYCIHSKLLPWEGIEVYCLGTTSQILELSPDSWLHNATSWLWKRKICFTSSIIIKSTIFHLKYSFHFLRVLGFVSRHSMIATDSSDQRMIVLKNHTFVLQYLPIDEARTIKGQCLESKQTMSKSILPWM